MRITNAKLETMVEILNTYKGKIKNEVGAYKLYRDGIGYSVHEIINESGGVKTCGHMCGMSAKECYIFIMGMKEML